MIDALDWLEKNLRKMFNPISRDKYLDEHHHITESAIGLARLHLSNNDYADARRVLDKACVDIDIARRNRLAAILIGRNEDLSKIDEYIPLHSTTE